MPPTFWAWAEQVQGAARRQGFPAPSLHILRAIWADDAPPAIAEALTMLYGPDAPEHCLCGAVAMGWDVDDGSPLCLQCWAIETIAALDVPAVHHA